MLKEFILVTSVSTLLLGCCDKERPLSSKSTTPQQSTSNVVKSTVTATAVGTTQALSAKPVEENTSPTVEVASIENKLQDSTIQQPQDEQTPAQITDDQSQTSISPPEDMTDQANNSTSDDEISQIEEVETPAIAVDEQIVDIQADESTEIEIIQENISNTADSTDDTNNTVLERIENETLELQSSEQTAVIEPDQSAASESTQESITNTADSIDDTNNTVLERIENETLELQSSEQAAAIESDQPAVSESTQENNTSVADSTDETTSTASESEENEALELQSDEQIASIESSQPAAIESTQENNTTTVVNSTDEATSTSSESEETEALELQNDEQIAAIEFDQPIASNVSQPTDQNTESAILGKNKIDPDDEKAIFDILSANISQGTDTVIGNLKNENESERSVQTSEEITEISSLDTKIDDGLNPSHEVVHNTVTISSDEVTPEQALNDVELIDTTNKLEQSINSAERLLQELQIAAGISPDSELNKSTSESKDKAQLQAEENVDVAEIAVEKVETEEKKIDSDYLDQLKDILSE